MDEVLRPTDESLSALAAQMGLEATRAAEPATPKAEARSNAASVQKSYSQLT